jgi:catechol-2,3-dioxygenase
MSSPVEDRRSQPAVAPLPFISAATKLGKVGLIVSNLQRSLDFYADIIGLQILARSERSAQLGVAAENRILIELEQRAGVRKLTGKRLGPHAANATQLLRGRSG